MPSRLPGEAPRAFCDRTAIGCHLLLCTFQCFISSLCFEAFVPAYTSNVRVPQDGWHPMGPDGEPGGGPGEAGMGRVGARVPGGRGDAA